MNGEMIVFFVLALTSIGGAVLMLNLTKVVHMLLALAFTFLSVAGLFFLLQAEFIAVAQILIYAGAVTIIMLFGIMLTEHNDADQSRSWKHKAWALIGVGAFFLLTLFAINGIDWVPQEVQLVESNAHEIGMQLFAHYVIPFELTSIVLLVGLIGAIILARRGDGPGGESEQHVSGEEGEAHD